jgi:DNA-binding MarR family transcriptional regulator
MVALWQHGPQTVGRLGSRLLLDSGTVSPLLKRLEGMGHVQRSRSGSDERRVVVALTEQGASLRAEAVEIHEQVVDRLGLPSDQLERLQEVLERLIEVTVRSTTRSLTGVQP